MADINNVTLAAGSSPTVNYTITYTKSRPNNTQMTYNFSISAALGSSGSFINAGYALLCTITVNGTATQVRIKQNDNDNWSGTTPRVRTVSVTCASTTGNATQTVRFQVVSDGRLTLSSGVIDNSSYTVTSAALLTTACGAPTALSVNQTIAEGNVTLSWSGAAGGTNNAISSYEIQYSDSTNNQTWGAWTALTTVTSTATSGSASVAPPTTRGNFRRFQVRTRGAAGSDYYSGWKVSTNSVRRNTAPTSATAASASPTVYANETVTLTWSGAAGGTSAIKGFMIASRTSTDNATWSAWVVLDTINLAASSGSYEPNISRVHGTYTQFGVWTIDALDVYSSEKISNSVLCNITSPGAPASVILSATLAEGNVTLSWSGATAGSGGRIAGYPVQFSDSTDNETWGEWTDLAFVSSMSTSASASVAPPPIRGNFRRFRVCTESTLGEQFNSPWVISSNTVRRNILPTPPTMFTAAPEIYTGNQVTVAWSGTVHGTSDIRQYVIQQSTSTDNQATWSAWSAAATVVTADTSGSAVVTVSAASMTFTRFRLSVTDTLNGVTDFVISNSVVRNSPPLAPLVEAPKAGSVTYNKNPICLIRTQPEPDGHPQTIWVNGANGEWYNSVDDPNYFTTPGATADSVRTVFFEPSDFGIGAHTITIKLQDDFSTGAAVTRSFTVKDSPFEEIVANETHVKASHILTLRTATNNVRDYYNLPPYVWAHEIVPGRTQVHDWPFHIFELRAAVKGIIDKINSFDIETGTGVAPIEWLPIGTGRPRADVMEQLVELILQL
jgi:hypothetical protein